MLLVEGRRGGRARGAGDPARDRRPERASSSASRRSERRSPTSTSCKPSTERSTPTTRTPADFPKTRDVTAQYLFLYSLSGGDKDFDTLLDPTHRHAKVRLLVHDDSTRYGQQLIARAREIIARTFPPGYQVRYTGTLASAAATPR